MSLSVCSAFQRISRSRMKRRISSGQSMSARVFRTSAWRSAGTLMLTTRVSAIVYHVVYHEIYLGSIPTACPRPRSLGVGPPGTRRWITVVRCGKRGVGREPDGRESELRSRNDSARWDGEEVASEAPSGDDETADPPGASPERREEEFPRPSRRARSRMLSEQKGAYYRGRASPPNRRGGVPTDPETRSLPR